MINCHRTIHNNIKIFFKNHIPNLYQQWNDKLKYKLSIKWNVVHQ